MALLDKPKLGFSSGKLPFGIHYSWVVIGILATVQIFASSISMAAGIMVPPLNDSEGAFGWSLGTIGVVIASYYMFGAIYAPMTGWLGDRYGSRWMRFAAAIMFLISMFLLGQVSEVWQFFLFFGVLLSLTQSLAMVPLMAAVSGWFRRRLGLGVGILWGAGGVGTGIMAPLMGGFIEVLGWQSTFMLIGGVGGGIMLAMVPFMRSKPADLGIQPYGARATDPPAILRDKTVDRLRQKVFNQHTRRTKPFWNLPLIHGLGCAGHGTILIYVIPGDVRHTPNDGCQLKHPGRHGLYAFLVPRSLGVLPVRRSIWNRLRRRVDGLPGHKPAVLRRRPDGNGLRLADHRRADGTRGCDGSSRVGDLCHRVIQRRHGIVRWIQRRWGVGYRPAG